MAGKDEAAGGFEVLEHAGGVNEQLLDEGDGFLQEVVGEDGGVGQDDALGGRVGDVALVPEGDVLEGGLGVRADDAGEAGDLLTGDGIALVRHGARTFLLLREELFGFADFGALEVADFGGYFVERGGEDGKRSNVGCVAISLNDLGRNVHGLEAERGADGFFVLRLEVTKGADGAGEFADTEVLGCGVEAAEVALDLRIPEQEFEAEGGGFGVDAVGAADAGRVLELNRSALQDFSKMHDSGANYVIGLEELERLCGVHNVG